MAHIHTIDQNFDYRVREILNKIKNDVFAIDNSKLSFTDWLWYNKEIVGEYFINDIDDFIGLDETIENLDN